MKKQLSQIAFDFFAPLEEPVAATPAPAKKEIAAPQPPAIIYANEENITPLMVEEPALETTVLSSKKLNTSKANITDRKPGKRGRRSLKDNLAAAAFVNIPPDEELYKKQYYSIGDVAAMFGEKQSLIRFWEIEFDILQPRKNRKGDRFFRPIDIKNLEMIYDLLRRRKFTIEGAKDYLKKNKQAEGNYAAIQSLEKIKAFLLELKASL
jgi:DNA-binding transcriptional MerR regulator